MRGGIKGYFANVKEKYKVKNHAVYYVLGAFTVLFSVLSLTGGLKMSDQLLLEQIGCYVIFAVSLSLVVGFLGELSLGHAGFICLGAYAGTLFRNNLAGGLTSGAPLLSLIVAMLFGGVVAALAGLLIGLPALRLKGDYRKNAFHQHSPVRRSAGAFQPPLRSRHSFHCDFRYGDCFRGDREQFYPQQARQSGNGNPR